MSHTMNVEMLRMENQRYQGSGGVSAGNRTAGFRPAFRDAQTAVVYLSRFADGEPAPFHLLDGLPDEVVLGRNETGRVYAVKETLVSGFVLDGRFYTREQAARKLSDLN
ncbi:MAG TPA: hypothetical protein PLX20_01235 [Rhodocyclaceae bacterium]|nr:hypothetical protein [Rhodocyclaceae bacterium]HMV53369.1 hypothetical protein [Rhodocyclaceae bacterium]HMZ83920.1 hypothetical protein [Rhodocyclaceae bacterium]HNA03569.1 hypothetical protein [Rhodocyclaceae bacterium]HNB77653.1 hypothetical protein [Rhodocyclaceae bacterium]